MSLSRFALGHKHTIWAFTLGILAFGLIAYFKLPIQLFPDTAPPLVNVMTAYPGAAAEDVAQLLTEQIERECASLEAVSRISGTSQDGLSLVEIEFAYTTSSALAAIDVQNAISRIRANLPADIIDPQVLTFSTSNRPIMTVGVMAEDLSLVRRLAEDILAPDLQRVPGVAIVDVIGGNLPQITIELDQDKLDFWQLSPAQVYRAVRENNVSLPGGQIRSSGRQTSFRMDARCKSAAELALIPLVTRQGRILRIGDLGTVNHGVSDDDSRFHVNGKAAIAMQIFRQEDANTVEVVEAARERISSLALEHSGIHFLEAEESASFTQQVVGNMLASVWQALLLAAVVIFLFLGSWKRGLVVILSMPLSFLITFMLMSWMNIQLDIVTLTAIILAVGMVVDSSVVVLENITRVYETENSSLYQAALKGAGEVEFSVIAGNLTTLVVLVPMLFLKGFVGKIFGPLALTLMIAFLSSLLVALMIVPLLTAVWGAQPDKPGSLAEKLTRPWNQLMDKLCHSAASLLDWAFLHRGLVLSSAFILFLAGLFTLRSIGMELLPKMDSGASFITIETPSGTSLDGTDNTLEEVERILLDEPELLRLSTQMGYERGMHSLGSGGVQGPTQAWISITWTPRTEREESIWQIQDRLREKLRQIPNIRNLVIRESGNTAKATTPSSIVVRLQGEDVLVLDALGDSLMQRVSPIAGVTNPWRSWRLDQRSTEIELQDLRGAEQGLDPSHVAFEMRAALDGLVAGLLRDEMGTETPIRVRLSRDQEHNLTDVMDLRLSGKAGQKSSRLGALSSSREKLTQGLVTRENLLSTLELRATHDGRPLSFVTKDIEDALDRMPLPSGYTLELAGEDSDIREARQEMLSALIVAMLGIYLILLAQFRSFRTPLTVMGAIPLTLIGAAGALYLGGMSVSMPVMIGLILLVGIVVNNSILLIDVANRLIEEGLDQRTALKQSLALRFRPIMMTSISTIAGMTPLAMGWALGAERFSPLAVAVMGGLATSTILTLIVIPVLVDAVTYRKPLATSL